MTQSPDLSIINSLTSVTNAFQTTGSFLKWLEKKRLSPDYAVEEKPISQLQNWQISDRSGLLRIEHDSGKFYTVEGISVNTNFGPISTWDQPIIIQPEFGILGIVSKVFRGVRHFLMQAKMEPGCVNGYQISPTVQATRSNYTRVHGGKLPPYVELFLADSKGIRTEFRYLQSEQTTRFLGKRNLNILIDIKEDVPILNNFKWLTLSEIKSFYHIANLVNMNTRSILACIDPLPIASSECIRQVTKSELPKKSVSKFQASLYLSKISKQKSLHDIESILSWLSNLKTKYFIEVRKIPLDKVSNWQLAEDKMLHAEGQYFSIVGAEVSADREVNSWDQPLVAQPTKDVAGLLAKKINGIYHFLFQAKIDPGNLDKIQLAPTVSCSVPEYREKKNVAPTFLQFFSSGSEHEFLLDVVLSEEGGRFYHAENIYRILILDDFNEKEIPENFIWIAYPQLHELLIHGYFNIESRTLISYLI